MEEKISYPLLKIMKKGLEDLGKLKFDFKRFITGIAFGTLIILSIFLLNSLGFFFIWAILISLSLYELFLIQDLNKPDFFVLPILLSLAIAYSNIFLSADLFILILFASSFLLLLKDVLFFNSENGRSIYLDLFSIIYAGFFLSFIVKIFNLPQGKLLLLLLFIIIWASDIFAYYGGRHFGRHLLYPSLSPKKTIEGALCGFAGAIVAALIFKLSAGNNFEQYNIFKYILIAGITVIVGMIGDLAESLIKRIAGKKDSGRIIPGHGGILDRIDSLILAAPVFYYMFFYLILKK
ncbi:MAG: phosphatidate cytidylyltransferase [bacterium]